MSGRTLTMTLSRKGGEGTADEFETGTKHEADELEQEVETTAPLGTTRGFCSVCKTGETAEGAKGNVEMFADDFKTVGKGSSKTALKTGQLLDAAQNAVVLSTHRFLQLRKNVF